MTSSTAEMALRRGVDGGEIVNGHSLSAIIATQMSGR